ncbi:CHY zinc finger protein, partial [Endozoicomonas sp. SESOKO3]|uniref:CHY zinc finger protein n=1 Tax=Endozoicomonas sp. SESOKO3 TaxID=2828744 RepID=UPI0021487D69
NQLIAIIESDAPDAVFKLGQILDELDMPQRLQVLKTEGTNNRGTPVTPLEAILELPRSFKEGSLRNRFIEQLIESTTDKTRTLNDFNIPSALQKIPLADQALSEAGDNNLSILSKIVQDIIRRVNQSDTQPPMGDFEKSCLTEHFVQLFLLYENPFGTIYELLGKISDVTIIRDILFCAHPFTYSSTFQEIFTRFEQHPSYFNFVRYSNSLMMLLRSFPATKEPSQREPSLQKLSLQKPVISNNDNASNGTMARGCSASDERQSLCSSDSTSNETIVSGGFASDERQSGCNSNNTSSETMASHGNTFTHTIRPFNSASGSGTSSLKTSTDKYLLQGAKPKQPARTDRSNDSSRMRSYSLRSYGDHQSNLTQDQFGWEVPGINPNFLRKHSNDHSLLVDQPHPQNASPARRSGTPRLLAATPLINPGNTFNADGSPEIHEPQNLDRSLEKLKRVVSQFQKDRREFERYRNIREKEEQKRQQINELTAQIQWLTTQNQWLTSQNQWLITENQGLNLEKQNLDKENQNLNAENRNLNAENQHLNAENQELTIKNQELDRDNQGLRGCVECYETDIGRLEAELQITRDELIQHRLHDRAHQAYHQMAERRPERCNCAMHRAARATTIQNEATNPLNEQASSSSGHLELTSASNITSGEYLPTAAASPVMPGNGGSLAPQPLNTFNEQLTPSNERSVLSNEELQRLPEQESRRPVCEHFQRFCYVGFDCCPGYFPCHRCHNDRGSCKAELKAVHAIRFMCSICGYEGEITEDSQTCPNCEEQMSEYYCAKCKHFTSKYNDPFHCHKCGICRMKASESFHCDVCGVCMHKMLKGNHKCRPGSAHDRCGICLEDAFSGCQILPCSHKIHKHCAIAMLRNGIRTCPVCRGPVFTE